MAEKSIKRLYEFSWGINTLFYSDEIDDNQLTAARNVIVDWKWALSVPWKLSYWNWWSPYATFANDADSWLLFQWWSSYSYSWNKSNVAFLWDWTNDNESFYSVWKTNAFYPISWTPAITELTVATSPLFRKFWVFMNVTSWSYPWLYYIAGDSPVSWAYTYWTDEIWRSTDNGINWTKTRAWSASDLKLLWDWLADPWIQDNTWLMYAAWFTLWWLWYTYGWAIRWNDWSSTYWKEYNRIHKSFNTWSFTYVYGLSASEARLSPIVIKWSDITSEYVDIIGWYSCDATTPANSFTTWNWKDSVVRVRSSWPTVTTQLASWLQYMDVRWYCPTFFIWWTHYAFVYNNSVYSYTDINTISQTGVTGLSTWVSDMYFTPWAQIWDECYIVQTETWWDIRVMKATSTSLLQWSEVLRISWANPVQWSVQAVVSWDDILVIYADSDGTWHIHNVFKSSAHGIGKIRWVNFSDKYYFVGSEWSGNTWFPIGKLYYNWYGLSSFPLTTTWLTDENVNVLALHNDRLVVAWFTDKPNQIQYSKLATITDPAQLEIFNIWSNATDWVAYLVWDQEVITWMATLRWALYIFKKNSIYSTTSLRSDSSQPSAPSLYTNDWWALSQECIAVWPNDIYYFDGKRVKSIGWVANYEWLRISEISDVIRYDIMDKSYTDTRLHYFDNKLYLILNWYNWYVYDMVYKSWTEINFSNIWDITTTHDKIWAMWKFNDELVMWISHPTAPSSCDVLTMSNTDKSKQLIWEMQIATKDYNLDYPFRQKVFSKVRIRWEWTATNTFNFRVIPDWLDRANYHISRTVTIPTWGKFDEVFNINYTGESIRFDFSSTSSMPWFVIRWIEFIYELLPEDTE